MNYRDLGRTGLRVSELGMGCSGIGRTLYRRDDRESLATLLESLDRGVNLFDTAPGYSSGECERLIGTAFRGRRDQLVIASKAGTTATAIGRLAKRGKHLLRPVRHLLRPVQTRLPRLYLAQRRVDFSRDFITRSLEASLKRLQTDYLDLLFLHHPTDAVLEEAGFRETMLALKQAGKIRHWGVSADTPQQAMLCLAVPGIEVIQLDISLLSETPLTAFLSRAREQNVGVVARKVLGQGLLAQAGGQTKADRWELDGQRLQERRRRAVQLASRQGGERSLLQAALLYVRGLEDVASAVVGYSTRRHLRENIEVYDRPLQPSGATPMSHACSQRTKAT
ncbi:MAG: aldo/keto reductase [Gammaproteobacteria bacterium]|jgi:aryl-alcohol dehydrogenase-like predicted oxidoreductase